MDDIHTYSTEQVDCDVVHHLRSLRLGAGPIICFTPEVLAHSLSWISRPYILRFFPAWPSRLSSSSNMSRTMISLLPRGRYPYFGIYACTYVDWSATAPKLFGHELLWSNMHARFNITVFVTEGLTRVTHCRDNSVRGIPSTATRHPHHRQDARTTTPLHRPRHRPPLLFLVRTESPLTWGSQ